MYFLILYVKVYVYVCEYIGQDLDSLHHMEQDIAIALSGQRGHLEIYQCKRSYWNLTGWRL